MILSKKCSVNCLVHLLSRCFYGEDNKRSYSKVNVNENEETIANNQSSIDKRPPQINYEDDFCV